MKKISSEEKRDILAHFLDNKEVYLWNKYKVDEIYWQLHLIEWNKEEIPAELEVF